MTKTVRPRAWATDKTFVSFLGQWQHLRNRFGWSLGKRWIPNKHLYYEYVLKFIFCYYSLRNTSISSPTIFRWKKVILSDVIRWVSWLFQSWLQMPVPMNSVLTEASTFAKACCVSVAQRQRLCSFLTRKRHPLLLRDTHLPWEGAGLFSSGVDKGGIRVHFRMKMINKISKAYHTRQIFSPKLMVLSKVAFSTLFSPRCSNNWISSWHLDMNLRLQWITHIEPRHSATFNKENMLSLLLLLDNGDSSNTWGDINS